MSDSEFCIHIKSVQASTIKILIEALKEILTDTVLIFNENGIKICTMDSSHIVLIHLKLEASKFEHFYCESEKLIGINMLNLNKIIKTINNNDTITLYMKKILRKLFLNNFKHIFYIFQNSNSHYFDYNKIELVIKKDCCLGVKNTKIQTRIDQIITPNILKKGKWDYFIIKFICKYIKNKTNQFTNYNPHSRSNDSVLTN